MVGKKGLSEVLGLNINGDLPDCKIADIALKAETDEWTRKKKIVDAYRRRVSVMVL